jgi:hypothetical protein
MTAMPDHHTDELTLSRREASAFDVVLRGYDREQVEERLLQWSEALTEAEDQRDLALEALQEARRQAERPSPALQISDRLRQILGLAEQEAADIRAEAAAEVRDAVERVRAEAADIREKAHADLRRDIATAQQEAEQLVAEAQAQARQILAQADEEAQDVAVTTARTRDGAHEAHQLLLAEHRREQDQVAEHLRQEIVAFEQRRDQVREQLEQLRDALSSSVGNLS